MKEFRTIISETIQEFLSELKAGIDYNPEKTSLNQISAGLKFLINKNLVQKGDVNLDYGGGKFDKGTTYLKSFGITNLVYDEFSRNDAHNQEILNYLGKNKVDTLTILNVLNVIHDKETRIDVIRKGYNYLKIGGYMLITVYYNPKMKRGLTSKGTWQEQRKLSTYNPEILEAIPNLSDNDIIARTEKVFAVRKSNELNLNSLDEITLKTQKGSAIKRYKDDVGKLMGSHLYVHKDYIKDVLTPEQYDNYLRLKSLLEQHIQQNPGLSGFDFNIVKYDLKTNAVSFLMSRNFDTAPEPTINASILVKPDGNISYRKEEPNPTIYHHKWTMVRDDYQGFNVQDAIDRSSKWLSLPDLDSSRIGRQDYWNKNVVPNIPQ